MQTIESISACALAEPVEIKLSERGGEGSIVILNLASMKMVNGKVINGQMGDWFWCYPLRGTGPITFWQACWAAWKLGHEFSLLYLLHLGSCFPPSHKGELYIRGHGRVGKMLWDLGLKVCHQKLLRPQPQLCLSFRWWLPGRAMPEPTFHSLPAR